MLRAILSAIGRSLRSLGRALTAPLRLINRLFGGGCLDDVPEIPEVEPYEPEVPAPDRQQIYADLAMAIMKWCADCVIADRPLPLPPRLPIDLKEWLPGLSRDEASDLMNAEKNEVSAHIQRLFAIPGVRPVQRLNRIETWPPEEEIPDAAGFAAIACLERDWPPPS